MCAGDKLGIVVLVFNAYTQPVVADLASSGEGKVARPVVPLGSPPCCDVSVTADQVLSAVVCVDPGAVRVAFKIVPEGDIAEFASVVGILGHVVECGMDVGQLSLNHRVVAYGNIHARSTLCLSSSGPRRHDDCKQCKQHYAEADKRPDQKLFAPLHGLCSMPNSGHNSPSYQLKIGTCRTIASENLCYPHWSCQADELFSHLAKSDLILQAIVRP